MVIEIAHRGDSHYHKDNSKESFLYAVSKGYDMIELDIQLSKDNKIFIYHDTLKGSKELSKMIYDDIKSIDNSILSLEEFFKLIDVKNIKIYLDVKGNDTKICKYLDEILKNIDFSNIYIASFNLLIIDELFKINSNYKYGVILENLFTKDIFNYIIQKYKLTFICFHWTMLHEDTINYIHNFGIKIFTYTCKENNLLSYMKQFKIDGIVTNYKIT